MHVDFNPQQVDWSFFTALPDRLDVQVGGGGLGGGGGENVNYPIFTGMAYQRGAGIGSVLRSLWRFLLPVGRAAGAAIGRQGLETGTRVLSGILDGKDAKETLVSEGKTGLKNLLDKAANNLEKQKGSGGQFDFKRYKRAATGDDQPSVERDIKRRLLCTLGPSIRTPTSKSTKRKATRKRRLPEPPLKVDALGPY